MLKKREKNIRKDKKKTEIQKDKQDSRLPNDWKRIEKDRNG